MTHSLCLFRSCAAACVAFLVFAIAIFSAPALAQATPVPGPRDAQPERPTVATHAYTVAPGYVELEAGFERQPAGAQSNLFVMPFLLKIGLGPRVQLDVAPGWQRNVNDGHAQTGLTDMVLGVKWRLADRVPVLGALAVQMTASLPTGSVASGTGTGSAALNVLAISSRNIGPVALDLNAGYTLRGGDGALAPKHETLWSVSPGFPIAGKVGMVAEVFGLPGTGGPAGRRPVVGFLTGPTWAVTRSLVLDAGAIINVSGFGDTAIYAGLTWNIGRAWSGSSRPSRTPFAPDGRALASRTAKRAFLKS
jgi:hypothetical protein